MESIHIDDRRENEQFFKEFINKYHSLPQLWDPSHEYYKNKYKRNMALDQLLTVMLKYDPSATRYNVRQKVNSMRSNYRKDLRRYLDSRRLLPNGEEIFEYKPSSWKFYALRFLDSIDFEMEDSLCLDNQEVLIEESEFVETACDYDSSPEDNEALEAQETTETDQVDETETIERTSSVGAYKISYIPNKKRKVTKKDVDRLQILNNLQATNREYEAVGANVALKLRRMNEEQRNHAELLINKVLINGLRNNLTEETDLTDLQVLDEKNFDL